LNICLNSPYQAYQLAIVSAEDGSGTLERSEFVDILSDPTVQQTLTRRLVVFVEI
jgi:hypothetical protein